MSSEQRGKRKTNPAFEETTDDELKLRFVVNVGVVIEGEALELLHELTARGYLYDAL